MCVSTRWQLEFQCIQQWWRSGGDEMSKAEGQCRCCITENTHGGSCYIRYGHREDTRWRGKVNTCWLGVEYRHWEHCKEKVCHTSAAGGSVRLVAKRCDCAEVLAHLVGGRLVNIWLKPIWSRFSPRRSRPTLAARRSRYRCCSALITGFWLPVRSLSLSGRALWLML